MAMTAYGTMRVTGLACESGAFLPTVMPPDLVYRVKHSSANHD